MGGASFHIEILDSEKYEEWDSFVDASPQGDIFCYSWWLEAITKSRFSILAAIQNGRIVAGMPLAFDSDGMINEPPLTRTLGILYSDQPHLPVYKQRSNQRKWSSALLEKIKIDDFIQTCTHHTINDWLVYRWKGLKQTTRYTYLVENKNNSIEDLWHKLNGGCRTAIKKAEKNGIKVRITDDFSILYSLVELTYKRQRSRFRIALQDLKALDDAIKVHGKRVILVAYDSSGRIHSAIYVSYNKKSAYFLLSGSDPEFRALGGHTLVFWEAIRYLHDKSGYCNLGGSDIQRIEKHLKDFGGILTPYYHIYNDNFLNVPDFRYHLRKIGSHTKGFFKSLEIILTRRLSFYQI